MAKAKGLWVDGDKLAGSLVGYDFLIAKHGAQFHNNVQKAYDAKIPCLLFYENDPTKIVLWGMNENNWANDPNIIDVINDIGSRAIHGVIVDCSKNKEANGNTLAVQWITRPAQNLISKVYKAKKKPMFVYMGYRVPEAYSDADKEYIVSFIKANEGSSTFYSSTSVVDGYPTDKPKLAYDDSGSAPCWFWLFRAVSGGIEVVYRYDKAQLYSDLSFTSGAVTPPPVDPPPVDPDPDEDPDVPPSTNYDFSSLVVALNAIKNELALIKEEHKEFIAWLKR